MKKILSFILVTVLFMFVQVSYANVSVDPEFMEEDSVDDDSTSVQTSVNDEENDSIETRERSEYNVDMRPYVNFRYVSSKTTIEHK